ncbi:MAG: ATP-binding protein [Saprospiraceae bacterium]
MAIAAAVLASCYLVVHLYMQHGWIVYLSDLSYIFFSGLILRFNYKKKYQLNNYILAYGYTFSYASTALYVGVHNQVEYFLILPVISCVFLFKSNLKKNALFVYCIVLFFAIKIFNLYYPTGILDEPYMPSLHFFNGGIIIITAFIIVNNIIMNREALAEDLRQKNEEIKKLNATLEEKVEERTKEIQQQSKALAQSNQEIKGFSYIAAHDMREPLRNIISFTQLMNKDIVNKKYDKIGEYSGYIDWSVRRIDALTRDIVDYTNLEEKIKQTSNVDLNNVIYEVILVSFERRKDAIFEVEALPIINVNDFVMKMLFKELIENAIQYCDKPQPSVKINYKELSDVDQFSVEDNGIGIEKEYHQKIFKMFKRLQNDIQQDGSGIGLSICNKVIQGYNGDIWIESEVGKGTTVHFTIPKVEKSK